MRHFHASLAASSVLLAAAVAVAGPIPGASIPAPLAAALARGDTRVLVIGDSISTATIGDPTFSNHSPILVGMMRRWQPMRWHGVPVSAPGIPFGSYTTMRGVGAASASNTDTSNFSTTMNLGSPMPDGRTGFATDNVIRIVRTGADLADGNAARAEMTLYPLGPVGNPASQSLLDSRTLVLRHIVYTSEAIAMIPALAARVSNPAGTFVATLAPQPIPVAPSGWHALDFPVGAALAPPFDRAQDALRVRTLIDPSVGRGFNLAHMGGIFLDPAAPGLQIHAIAQGGWNNVDHLNTQGTSGRGYTNDGLRANLQIFGMTDPGVTPVVMITTGANIAPGEAANGGASPVYEANVRAIMARARAAVLDSGGAEPWFLLVNMYSISLPPPDSLTRSRAERLWTIALDTPRTGFIDLTDLLGERGDDFPSAWYYNQPETTLAADYPGGPTLTLTNASAFVPPGSIYMTTPGFSSVATFGGRTGNTLTGVVAGGWPMAAGARVFNYGADLHLSLAGSEAAAQAMWDAIVAADVCPSTDFDGDGDAGTDADIEAFFAVLGGLPCSSGACGSIDFDGDGDEGTDADIETFFLVLGGGAC